MAVSATLGSAPLTSQAARSRAAQVPCGSAALGKLLQVPGSRHFADRSAISRLIPPRRDRWDTIAAMVLPGAWTAPHGAALAQAVVIDFLLIGSALFSVTTLISLCAHPVIPARTICALAVLQGCLTTLIGYAEGLYGSCLHARSWRALAKAILCATAVTCVCAYLSGHPLTSLPALATAGLLSFAGLGTRRQRIHRPAESRNIIIVGQGANAQDLAARLNSDPTRNLRGLVTPAASPEPGALGTLSDLPCILRAEFVDEVIVAQPASRELLQHVLQQARQSHVDLKVAPETFDAAPYYLELCGRVALISLYEERIPELGLRIKRAIDCLAAAVLLLLLLPVFLLIALLIKLDSPGPVLYIALRAGRKGRPFRCFKFRTMLRDAEIMKERLRALNERQGPFFKMKGDPRITRVGKLLRRYSLDELPQLFNVLRAEMSLVGPRPHPLDDVRGYSLEHLQRLDVVPGLTGLWQTRARHDPSFERNMDLDLEYVRRWSLTQDFRILLNTVGVVFRGEGT